MAHTTTNLGLPVPDTTDTADVPRDLGALAALLDSLAIAPAGGILMWPGATAPTGWAILDGSRNLNATDNPKLAALFGTASGKVAIPDLRERFPMGAGATAPLAAGGTNSVALGVGEMPTHAHGGLTGPRDRVQTHAHPLANGADNVGILQNVGNGSYMGIANTAGGAGWWSADTVTVGNADPPNHLHTISYEGSGAAHENRPAFVALNFIVKLG